MMKIKTIQDHNSTLLDKALALIYSTQGVNVCQPSYLKRAASSPDELLLLGLVEEKLMAVAVAKVLSGSMDYYLPFGKQIVDSLAGFKVGSLSSMSVAPAFQGQGHAQQLMQARLDWLKDQGCQKIVGISWVSHLTHTSDRVFEKMGLKRMGEVKEFYLESSLKDGLECPVCLKPPCRCSAALYLKTL